MSAEWRCEAPWHADRVEGVFSRQTNASIVTHLLCIVRMNGPHKRSDSSSVCSSTEKTAQSRSRAELHTARLRTAAGRAR